MQEKNQGGFTLIELMVTIAVLAIVVTIAAPSFTTMIRNNQSLALGEELVNAINYARAEAVKRGAKVSICASSDGATCAGAGNWTQGWIVVSDNAVGATGNPQVDTVLRTWQAPNSGAAITVTRDDGAAAGFIRFVRLGTTEPNGAVTVASSISGCKGEAGRTITVGPAGLVNVARSDANCS